MRWTDERLDDFAKRIEARLKRVEDVNDRLTRVEGKVDDSRDDLREIKSDLRLAETERAEEREKRDRERRENIRWLVGTVLAATTIIVSAIGIFLGAVS
jgi:chromosome segregation ATPase